MKTTQETVSGIAAVSNIPAPSMEEIAAKAREAEKARRDKETEKAEKQRQAMDASPSFRLLGSSIKTLALENAVNRIAADCGRLVTIAKENKLGNDVKSVGGGKVKVVTIKTVREMAKRFLLGDKDKTAARLSDAIALENLIDSMVHFGLMERLED